LLLTGRCIKQLRKLSPSCNRLLPQEKYFQGIEVLICPPFTALAAAAAALEGSSIKLGAQNMSWEEEGAYTGEIAPQMLKEFRVSHVIPGPF